MRINPESFANLDKFNDIQPALASFIFGYKRLGAVQSRRNLGLC